MDAYMYIQSLSYQVMDLSGQFDFIFWFIYSLFILLRVVIQRKNTCIYPARNIHNYQYTVYVHVISECLQLDIYMYWHRVGRLSIFWLRFKSVVTEWTFCLNNAACLLFPSLLLLYLMNVFQPTPLVSTWRYTCTCIHMYQAELLILVFSQSSLVLTTKCKECLCFVL